MGIKVLGIDLAKNKFELCGVDDVGKVVLRKTLSRFKLTEFVQKLPLCLIGMEACGGAHYWGRKFQSFGHTVKLMNPAYVKAYVKTNKNDRNDAEGICEAVSRPTMRFVAVKSVEQQDIQSIHRVRSGLVRRRTVLANQIRGLLAEYGIVIAQGISVLFRTLPHILEDAENGLTVLMRELIADAQIQLQAVNDQVKSYTKKLKQLCSQSEVCTRLKEIPGVGELSATALVSSIGDAKLFKNGRQLAAWLGLVPKQKSSGNKQILLGISKRGDAYLRQLLIQGAQALLRHAANKIDKHSLWLKQLIARVGKNKTAVALANKNARMVWALMAKQENYKFAI